MLKKILNFKMLVFILSMLFLQHSIAVDWFSWFRSSENNQQQATCSQKSIGAGCFQIDVLSDTPEKYRPSAMWFTKRSDVNFALDENLQTGGAQGNIPLPWNSWFNTFFSKISQASEPGIGTSMGPLTISYTQWGRLTFAIPVVQLGPGGMSPGDSASFLQNSKTRDLNTTHLPATLNANANNFISVSPQVNVDSYKGVMPKLHSWSDFSASFKFVNPQDNSQYYSYTMTEGSPFTYFDIHGMPLQLASGGNVTTKYLLSDLPQGMIFYKTYTVNGSKIGVYLKYGGYQLMAIFYDESTVKVTEKQPYLELSNKAGSTNGYFVLAALPFRYTQPTVTPSKQNTLQLTQAQQVFLQKMANVAFNYIVDTRVQYAKELPYVKTSFYITTNNVLTNPQGGVLNRDPVSSTEPTNGKTIFTLYPSQYLYGATDSGLDQQGGQLLIPDSANKIIKISEAGTNPLNWSNRPDEWGANDSQSLYSARYRLYDPTSLFFHSVRGPMLTLEGNSFTNQQLVQGILPYFPPILHPNAKDVKPTAEETKTLKALINRFIYTYGLPGVSVLYQHQLYNSEVYTDGKLLSATAQVLMAAHQLGYVDVVSNPNKNPDAPIGGLNQLLNDNLQDYFIADPQTKYQQQIADFQKKNPNCDPVTKCIPLLGAKYFVYDQGRNIMYGEPAGFDNATILNDHNLTYGYLVEVANILGESWLDNSDNGLAKALNQVIYEYNNPFEQDSFPIPGVYQSVEKKDFGLPIIDYDQASADNRLLTDDATPTFARSRSYDPYLGHSIASGIQQGVFGPNQESISEDINSAANIALHAAQTGNDALESMALAQYASEVNAANTYWYDKPKYYSTFDYSNTSKAANGSRAVFVPAIQEDLNGPGKPVPDAWNNGVSRLKFDTYFYPESNDFANIVSVGGIAQSTFFGTEPVFTRMMTVWPLSAHSFYVAESPEYVKEAYQNIIRMRQLFWMAPYGNDYYINPSSFCLNGFSDKACPSFTQYYSNSWRLLANAYLAAAFKPGDPVLSKAATYALQNFKNGMNAQLTYYDFSSSEVKFSDSQYSLYGNAFPGVSSPKSLYREWSPTADGVQHNAIDLDVCSAAGFNPWDRTGTYLKTCGPQSGIADGLNAGYVRYYQWIKTLENFGQPNYSISANIPFYLAFTDNNNKNTYVAYNAQSAPQVVVFSDNTSATIPALSMIVLNDDGQIVDTVRPIGVVPPVVIPSAPSITVSNIAQTSATVAWTDADSNEAEYTYHVVVQDPAGKDIFNQSFKGSGSQDLTSLTADTTYKVNITASYQGETSTPTVKTFTTQSAAAPTAPTVTINGITQNSATVAWTDADAKKADYSYAIVVKDPNGKEVFSQTVTGPGSRDVSGLQADTTYTVNVTASYQGETSAPTVKTFTTQLAIAPSAPTVSVSNISQTSATVAWTDSDVKKADYTYHVVVQDTNGQDVFNQSIQGPGSRGITGLAVDTQYKVTVSASYQGKTSISVMQTFTTLAAAVPSAPTVSVSNVSQTSARVAWTDADVNKAEYSYHIVVQDPNGQDVFNQTIKGPGNRDIAGLTADTAYTVRVTASYNAKQSMTTVEQFTTSSIVITWTNPDLQASNVTADSATISWNAATVNPNETIYYEVSVNGGAPQRTTNTRFDLSQLTPDTNYNVEVIATVAGAKPIPATTKFTTLPAVLSWPDSNLTASKITTDSATLTWNPATTIPAGGTIKYEVSINGATPNETSATIYPLSKLSPDTSYAISVQAIAKNSVPIAALTTFTTKSVGVRPEPPTKIQFFYRRYWMSSELSWREATANVTFKVVVEGQLRGGKTRLEVKSDTASYTFSANTFLRNRNYSFRVYAISQDGVESRSSDVHTFNPGMR